MPTAAATAPLIARAGRISSDTVPAGGFTPGMILLDRYRIVGLLGRGGMGEVYRADDLKLGQPVALKFLPRAFAADPVRRERFFAEVRITRQLSHPNICRVYDIAEYDGQHFLSMEYIDGEDLASLIQRIGYLSNEKALQIARQLAAGMAAAHERGVLHRDLKPANIMIDGHGRARITDFGLAVIESDDTQAADAMGTPAYMAPEQFAGKAASVSSDIYALGLIFYEVFTGKRAFTAATIAELREQKEHRIPAAPSEFRQGIDPAAERVIMRCLERDPRLRPASMAQLAAVLPGGDPLAAAIAAGETPSPDMVAAAGQKEGIHPRIAVALLVCVIIAAFGHIMLSRRASFLEHVGPGKSPEVLAERAREFLRKTGYTEGGDQAFGYSSDNNFLNYIRRTDKTAARWETLREFSPLLFWYRQSAQPMQHSTAFAAPSPAIVTIDDPPMQPGDVWVQMDNQGRLRRIQALPQPLPDSANTPALDWAALLTEAGLNPLQWTPVIPTSNSTVEDARMAWTGSLAASSGITVRIEAAAYRGKPVYFEILGPWPQTRNQPLSPLRSFFAAITFGLIAAALILSRQNWRSGRGDRRGAARLTSIFLILILVSWLLGEHHTWAASEWNLAYLFLGRNLMQAALLWGFYIALEPLVRRRWPQILISWTRVLAGDLRDPLVGRDILIGCATAAVYQCLISLQVVIAEWFGATPAPAPQTLNYVLRTNSFVSYLTGTLATGIIIFALGFLLFVLLLRTLLKRDWLAITIAAVALTSLTYNNQNPAITVPVLLAASILVFFVLVRFGFVALFSGIAAFLLFGFAPIAVQTSAWYSGYGVAALLMVAALTIYGFHTSLGSRRVLDIP
jgi:serine/threonine-protein kinase